jgi:hypothetical protein
MQQQVCYGSSSDSKLCAFQQRTFRSSRSSSSSSSNHVAGVTVSNSAAGGVHCHELLNLNSHRVSVDIVCQTGRDTACLQLPGDNYGMECAGLHFVMLCQMEFGRHMKPLQCQLTPDIVFCYALQAAIKQSAGQSHAALANRAIMTLFVHMVHQLTRHY